MKAASQWNLGNSYNKTREIFFFQSLAENEAGRLVPKLFLFFKKLYTEAAVQMCSWENLFWKHAVNLQENTRAEARFQ